MKLVAVTFDDGIFHASEGKSHSLTVCGVRWDKCYIYSRFDPYERGERDCEECARILREREDNRDT